MHYLRHPMWYSSRQFCKTLAVLTASIVAGSCSPVYSIGVRSALTQPLNVECILHAAQTVEGVQQVLIHQNKPREGEGIVDTVDNALDPPTVYLVTTIDQDVQIEQRLLKDGQAILWVGRRGIGIRPSTRTIEMDQAFDVRLASHITDVCKVRYLVSGEMTCIPDSEVCRKLLTNLPPLK